jgi:DinB superfamily
MADSFSFDPDALIARLARFGHVLPAVARCFSDPDVLWMPDADSWSVLEIVCHLADEEHEDFPTRVFLTLEDPAQDWPGIDPEGWAISRGYQSRDLKVELARFVEARSANIERLGALKNPNWSSTKQHPKFGPMVASDLLAAWCAHDALHLRQLSKRLYQLANRDGGEGSTTRYAGTWS